MGELTDHARTGGVAADIEQNIGIGVGQGLDDAGHDGGRIEKLFLTVHNDALFFKQLRDIAAAEEALGLIHVKEVNGFVGHLRHELGKIHGQLRLSGASLSNENEIFLSSEQLAHDTVIHNSIAPCFL